MRGAGRQIRPPATPMGFAAGPFEPDVLMPAQWQALTRGCEASMTPERKLALAVLLDAVDDFQKYAHARDVRGRALFDDVHEWIAQADERYAFSFRPVCHAVGLDPDYLYSGLLRWRAAHQPYVRTVPRMAGMRRSVQGRPTHVVGGGRG